MSFPRYPKYKHSGVEWLGDMPEHWEVVPLKHLCVLLKDGTHLPPERVDDGVPLLSVRNLVDGEFVLRDDDSMIAEESYRELCRAFVPQAEDVLLAIVGATLGKTAIIPAGLGPIHIQRSLAIFRTRREVVPPTFLSLVFQSHSFQSLLWELVGYSAQPGIYLGTLQNLRMPVPPRDEQTKIASFLDRETSKIDGLVGEQRRLIELLKEKRQAVISHAVTKGLNPHAPLKPSGIEWLGDVPEHWEVKKIKHLSSRISSGKTPLGGSEVYVDEGITFLRSQNVYDEGLRLDDVVFITAAVDEAMAVSRVIPNDILLNITGASIGRSSVVPNGFPSANVNQHVCVIRLKKPSQVPFVGWLFKSATIKNQIDHAQNGAAREGLNFVQIGEISLSLPPDDERKSIACFLDQEIEKFDALTAEAERGIALLQERRTALISAAVTGQIDVRGLVATEAA